MSVSVDGGQSAYDRYRAEVERRRQEEIERRKREEEERKKAEAKRKAEEQKKAEQAEQAERAEETRQAEEDRRAEEDRKATEGSVFAEQEDNEDYFDRQRGTTAKGGTTSQTVDNLNDTLEQRNKTDDTEIHGMSDQEYAEYRRIMWEEYGIALEDGFNYGHFQNVAVAMGESCSQGTRYSAQCKVAQSYDTVLDLVLDAKLSAAIADIFKGDTDPNWESLCKSGNAGRLLKEYGIQIVKTGDRQYCFSLVDENGNVIQDSEGHLAQVYKNDYLMPDGQCQQNEVHVSAALDAMGFDCWSVLDLSKEEYQMVLEMAKMNNSDLGTASQFKGNNELAIRAEVLGTYDKNTRTWSKAKKQDNSSWVNGTYTDKVTGEVTGAKKRYREFLQARDSGAYRGLHNLDGSESGRKTANIGAYTGDFSNVHGAAGFPTVDQAGFNRLVEKYLGFGYSFEESMLYANAEYGTDYNYTGDSKEKPRSEKTTFEITQDDYNEAVEDYMRQGYNIEKAIDKANDELNVDFFDYKGRYADLLEQLERERREEEAKKMFNFIQ